MILTVCSRNNVWIWTLLPAFGRLSIFYFNGVICTMHVHICDLARVDGDAGWEVSTEAFASMGVLVPDGPDPLGEGTSP